MLRKSGREHVCIFGPYGVAGPTAYALAKLGWHQETATLMERGRARLPAEALQRSRRDLEQLPTRGHPELYRCHREIVHKQEHLTQPANITRPDQPDSLPGPARLDTLLALSRDFEQVVAEIQQLPGYEDFLTEPTFAQIQAAANDTPLVYLLATSLGGLALLIQAGEVQPIWLDTLADTTIRELLRGPADTSALDGWLGAYGNWIIERTPKTKEAWLATIDDVTAQLWTHLMGPLAAALHRRLPGETSAAPAVTLIPTSLLALLPLHAAWTEDLSTPTGRLYFLDEFTVSYAPSARALHHAREAAERAVADRVLAVEEPLAAGASPLPNVHAEVTAIAGLFETPVILPREKATRQNVLKELRQVQVIHFACHGSNNWQSALESGLLMADDENGKTVWLTVRDLLASGQVGGRLATLSACETGIIGMDLSDEVVALPSALLKAGFGGVAASLWSVANISTAMLMEHFYRCWREERLPPAQALRAAQRWLRDTTNCQKAEYFQRYKPELAGIRMPEAVALDFFTQSMSRPLDEQDFAHPFWWAAFYLTGV
jgi:CHAT domain-containing protein